MTHIDLSALEHYERFILLGPGFGFGRWQLFSNIRPAQHDDDQICWIGRYDTARGHDFLRLTGDPEPVEFDFPRSTMRFVPCIDEDACRAAIDHIRYAIAAGDVYQVNYTQRVSLGATTGAEILGALCRRTVPRFAAWVRLPNGVEFVSGSPELLFETNDRHIGVEPMKGTAPATDRLKLESSEKDQAELAMVADLLRDDLNHVCERHSVRMASPRRFIELPYAIQTVADIQGTLQPHVTLENVLDYLHPGGSITGAPRASAMTMIEKLESSNRGIYCGSLGLQRGNQSRFALLIRTAEKITDGTWVYGVGSGITWDSRADEEIREFQLKLGALS